MVGIKDSLCFTPRLSWATTAMSSSPSLPSAHFLIGSQSMSSLYAHCNEIRILKLHFHDFLSISIYFLSKEHQIILTYLLADIKRFISVFHHAFYVWHWFWNIFDNTIVNYITLAFNWTMLTLKFVPSAGPFLKLQNRKNQISWIWQFLKYRDKCHKYAYIT